MKYAKSRTLSLNITVREFGDTALNAGITQIAFSLAVANHQMGNKLADSVTSISQYFVIPEMK